MPGVAPGGTGAAGAWFVVPVMPGLASQVTSFLTGGGHGTYQVVFAAGQQAQQYISNGFPHYPTKAEAQQEAQTLTAQAKASQTGVGNTPSKAVPNPLGGLAAIGDFFGRLTEASTWIRIGEAVLGLILIAIGLARITGTANAVASIAKARIP
jgi:NADH dehydrogenase FAD-containing subunit